jgi:hypothetical protein
MVGIGCCRFGGAARRKREAREFLSGQSGPDRRDTPDTQGT